MIQASGQASWADPFWLETLKHAEGQHITSSSGVNLDMEWGCSFTADACRQFYHGVCFIVPWGTGCCLSLSLQDGCLLQFHQLHWQTIHHMGVFPQCWLVLCQLSSPFHCIDDGGPLQLHQVKQHVCPQCQSCGTLHASGLFWSSHCRWNSMRGQLSWPGECEQVQLGYTSMACSSEVGSLGRGHGWPCQQTSWMLQIWWHNTCDWSPVGQILFNHNSPGGAPSAAQCWYQGWLKWACIGLQTQWQNHYHHLSVHGRQVGIPCLWVHW